MADLTVIKETIDGLRIGPCGEYLDRCKPQTMGELFDIMQEYCKSDKRRRRRIEALNYEKKEGTNQWSQPKP
ncbi:polyprotein [Panicum miliaceum]|uniref:Polyprotein n=1 Tax=Panicum miliaceum TaxID=4540 RepID=A0A3L6PN54_PANMI|nr:polyprotein [Panicum miliaceum]